MKYIDQIPKPLLEDFLNARVIPFVGAGFSKNADIPSGITMPDWKELGEMAASNIPGYSFDGNSIDSLSYYEELYSRPKLVEFIIRNTGGGVVTPGKAYEAFCKLFTGIICTTNFDALIERELTILKMPFTTIATEDRLSVMNADECRVIKVHGDFDHPNKMVVTERDYDRYLIENPIMATYIANLFIGNTMLLVGYSLDDNDLRGILQIINDRLGKMTLPVYCITLNASQDKIDRYKRRNIKVINFEDKKITYRELYINLFNEIKEYLEEKRSSKITSGDDNINAQFVVPSSENILCYLSSKAGKITLLSKQLKSILRDAGMMLVKPDDVLSFGENVMDTITTLIGKCNMAIVDITEYSRYQEYEIISLYQTMAHESIIFICEDSYDEAYELYVKDSKQIIVYKSDSSVDENFSKNLLEAVRTIRGEVQKTDIERLFEAQQYSACIVMAYVEMEIEAIKLQKKVEAAMYGANKRNSVYSKYYSLYGFFSKVLKMEQKELDDFRELQMTRNRIVHENIKITKKEAEKYLALVKLIKERIKQNIGA